MPTIGLSPYLLLGYPDAQTCLALVDAYVQQGVRMIEVGIPFSEPQADGPVLTKANTVMVEKNFSVAEAIALITQIRSKYPTLKITLMTYINPLLHYGLEQAFAELEGLIDYLLIPDVPLEELNLLPPLACKRSMIVGDTMNDAEIQSVVESAQGFLYVMTSVSTTGNTQAFSQHLQQLLQRIQSYNTQHLPLCAGFGIRTHEDVQRLAAMGFDGFIVGTRLVEVLHEGGVAACSQLVKSLVIV